jgi:peptidoglycan/LPS O-acetylase OafA/YrhL
MKKFEAIEGLRGWLAWTVVFSHLAWYSNLKWKGVGYELHTAGLPAVLVFIIISGFVITHLILQRPEPYGLYLLRRFMRIFPLFAVACVLGYFTNDLQANLLALTSDVSDPEFSAVLSGIARSNHDFFWQHFVAHLTMLHGTISDSLLPFSQYAFSMPGWSVSLEWQFYLLAPILIGIARSPRAVIWLAALIFIAETAYQKRMFGSFVQPSLLAAVAGYFAVGIASRLFYPSVAGTLRYSNAMLAVVIVLFPLLDNWGRPLLIWIVTFIGIARAPSVSESSFFARLYTPALESPIAIYFGSRSFSTYLCHMPVIAVCYWFWLLIFSRAPGFIALSATVIPMTMITSELLYRGVERPGIALGTRLALGYQAIARKRQRAATKPFGSTPL